MTHRQSTACRHSVFASPSTRAHRLPRSLRSITIALGATLLAGGALATPPQRSAEGPWAKGRLLVQPNAGLSAGALARLLGQEGGRASRIGNSGIYLVELPPQASERAVLARLQHNPHLKFAELDRQVAPTFAPNDPYFGSAWHLPKIGAPAAWDSSQGSGVTIAVLDTGVDSSHADLSAAIVPGWNTHANSADTTDGHGHGTAVAGAAAARFNNGIGVAGAAGQAKIMPIRISDATGYAYYSSIASGITYAADRGVRIANISYVDLMPSSAILSAAAYMKSRNGLVFIAAGNAGTQQSYAPSTSVIPVSGTDSNDQLASWSSYGNYVALSAPGLNIWTTNRGGGYGAWYGTSFATPVASGVGALVMAAKPTLSATQVESLLFANAADLGTPGRDAVYGHGRVDAAAAVAAALGSSPAPAPDTQAPTAGITSPTGGSTVSGLVAIGVTAVDNVGVTRVELRVNGALHATDSASPFAFSWDSASAANGPVSLVATAYDAAGNAGLSATVVANVSNVQAATDTTPPSVAITSPTASSLSGGSTVTVSASASDNAGAAGITQRLYINGGLVSTQTGGTLSYGWNTRKASAGTYTLQVLASDGAGNTSAATRTLTLGSSSSPGSGSRGKGK